MTKKQREKEVIHWRSVIRRYDKISYERRPLTSDEHQQRLYAQSKIDALYKITFQV
jgi:hypothetical protein